MSNHGVDYEILIPIGSPKVIFLSLIICFSYLLGNEVFHHKMLKSLNKVKIVYTFSNIFSQLNIDETGTHFFNPTFGALLAKGHLLT